MRKIVVVCDSMKGSLTQAEVAHAVCDGVQDALQRAGRVGEVAIVSLNVADGGEGTARAVMEALGGRWLVASVSDPLRRNVEAPFGVVEVDGVLTAVIEMASASGLTLLKKDERNPLITTSYGTGQLMLSAWDAGCRRFIIGIGGSATNDAGKGMLEALGVKFLDAYGQALADGGASLAELASLDLSEARMDILGADITVMCDVSNTLCGQSGASAVYGPQKGASAEMVARLDAALGRFAEVVNIQLGRDVTDIPGAGAAGGVGAAFMAFTDARLTRGIDGVLDLFGFDRLIADADFVITGEGRADGQTLSGKVPFGVLQRCRGKNVPVYLIAGSVGDDERLRDAGFADVIAVSPPSLPLEEAMHPAVARTNISASCSRLVSSLLK